MRLPNWPGQSLSRLWAPVAPYTPYLVRGVFIGTCLLTPVLLFLCFFTPEVLDPTRIGWTLEADWGQHFLGWNAWRGMPWSTFNHETLLGAPMGNTLQSTDSNPPFAFLFKPFAAWLPQPFQYIGLWFGFCVVMHVMFAYKLVRPHAPGRWLALGGAVVLSALPMLYYRMRHDTLVAQWVILWALHLFINVREDGLPEGGSAWRFLGSWFRNGSKMLGYAGVLGFTGMLHPYLLFMVAAIWGGDVLRRFWPAALKMDRPVIFDSLARAAFAFAAAVFGLFVGGAFNKGMSPGAGGYSYYSFPIDGWFNPVRPEFSTILKAWPLDGGQSFEGYQYLGVGLIALIITAATLYALTPEARRARTFIGGLVWLVLPFLVLFLIAVTNHGQVYGHTLWKFPVPSALSGPLAVLRASGRLVWPITYCLVLVALVVVLKSRPKVAAVTIPLVLLVQAYDLSGFAAAMRAATSLSANPQVYYLTPSPQWDQLVTLSKGIDFYPANVHFNDKLFYELTWRATSQVKPVNTMYAARLNMIQAGYEEAGQDAFKRGTVNDDHLFVFLKQCDAPASLWPRLRMLDGVWIIPPKSAEGLDLARPQWSPLTSKMRFGWLDQATCLLDENWSKPENDGVWSDGPRPAIVIPIRHVQFTTERPRRLDLNLVARSRVPVEVTVLANGVRAGKISLSRQRSESSVRLPASALRRDKLEIRFVVEGDDDDVMPAPPAARTGGGRSTIDRSKLMIPQQDETPQKLGIKLMRMTLTDPDAPPPPPPLPPVSS